MVSAVGGKGENGKDKPAWLNDLARTSKETVAGYEAADRQIEADVDLQVEYQRYARDVIKKSEREIHNVRDAVLSQYAMSDSRKLAEFVEAEAYEGKPHAIDALLLATDGYIKAKLIAKHAGDDGKASDELKNYTSYLAARSEIQLGNAMQVKEKHENMLAFRRIKTAINEALGIKLSIE